MNNLTAHNLSVTLGGAEVLRGVNCAMQPGTLTAICGPNGAGKSTLLAALAGLQAPDSGAFGASGNILLDGAALSGLALTQRARRIGYLPQLGEIAWDLPVAALIALGRLPHGDVGAAQVAAALKAVGLEEFAARPVSSLSGGERARALLGRVLAGEPDWILADEPLAALDLGHQLAMLKHLRMAADSGAGVVLVLHDLALAMNHADHVLVLDHGICVSEGTPEQALPERLIADVWGVEARWVRAAGVMALATG